jgi:Fe-S-cluster-containing dehydrogenase component
MYKDEKGIVHNDKKRCISYMSCVLVCPFGAVKKMAMEKPFQSVIYAWIIW